MADEWLQGGLDLLMRQIPALAEAQRQHAAVARETANAYRSLGELHQQGPEVTGTGPAAMHNHAVAAQMFRGADELDRRAAELEDDARGAAQMVEMLRLLIPPGTVG